MTDVVTKCYVKTYSQRYVTDLKRVVLDGQSMRKWPLDAVSFSASHTIAFRGAKDMKHSFTLPDIPE